MSGQAWADERTWTGGGEADNDWFNVNNWNFETLPSAGDYAVLDPAQGISFSGGTNEKFNCINLYKGTMEISGGLFQADLTSPWDSQVGRTSGETGTVYQTGGEARYVFMEIGRANGAVGVYDLSGGTFVQSGYSRLSGYGLFLGRQDSGGVTGSEGTFAVSGGSVITRYGVMLGDSWDGAGVGVFSVQGAEALEISIGGYTNEAGSGAWYQNTGSTLKLGVDSAGITPIQITDGDAYFAYGSTVDVSFVDGHLETNRWTVMTVDGTITDEGLLMADGVDTDMWNFGVTNGNELWISYGMGGWTAPSVPPPTSGFYAWPTAPQEVTLGWDENPAAIGYNVQRSTESGTNYVTIATGESGLTYTDTSVSSKMTYYYKVSGVNEAGEGLASDEYKAVVIPYTIIGTEDVWDESDSTQYKYSLFDEDVATYFDGQGSTAWAGLDFGEDNAQQIVEVRYVLRADANAFNGSINAQIQGANDEYFLDAVTLYTLNSNSVVNPAENTVAITNTTAFRYVRLTAGNRNAVNYMAEIDFILTSDFTAKGTYKGWLDDYYDVDADFGGVYETADISDSDGDSLLAWEEYVAGTVPTNAASLLELNSVAITTNGVVVSWQSVEGKSYHVESKSALVGEGWSFMASNITGQATATSCTGTVSGAGTVFYQIGVE
jgi:hypothetical protein